MLQFTKAQMDALDLMVYRRHALTFVERELRLFDHQIDRATIRSAFEEFSPLIGIGDPSSRLTLVLLLFASFAFADVFTRTAIGRLMAQGFTSEKCQKVVQDALLKHGYDSRFLQRGQWF